MECGESLVPASGRVNELSVSPVVNTKAYHDAFEAMPLARCVTHSAYEQAGRILRATRGTEFEHMVAIDARTGRLVADNLGRRPTKAKTGFNDVEMRKVATCRSGVVLIHNHPASKPPSYRDVMTAATYSAIVASVIVGHDGSVWYVAVDDARIALSLVGYYNDFKDSKGDLAEALALNAVLRDNERHRLFDWRRLR